MINRPTVVFYHLSYCPACKAFYERILEPLYRNYEIDLIKVDVEIDKEIKALKTRNLLKDNPFVGYKLHYDFACRKHGRCVVPAVEIIPPHKREGIYRSTFIFTNGNENAFEKTVMRHINEYINAVGVLRY